MYDQAQSARLGQKVGLENPGVRLVDTTADVLAPYEGQLTYDVGADALMAYVQGAWVSVGGGGGGGATVADTGWVDVAATVQGSGGGFYPTDPDEGTGIKIRKYGDIVFITGFLSFGSWKTSTAFATNTFKICDIPTGFQPQWSTHTPQLQWALGTAITLEDSPSYTGNIYTQGTDLRVGIKNHSGNPTDGMPLSFEAVWLVNDPAPVEGGSGGGGSGSLSANTVDTNQPYRIILFSNGTVKAIPSATPTPVAPTGVAATAKIASVRLTWTAASTPAASYEIFRDGVKIGSSFGLSYRDGTVVVSSTYNYTVRTVDAYGQTSPLSTPAVSAYIDPTLNHSPTVTVTCWPPTAPTNGKTIVRVAAQDIDAQTMLLALGVDTGTVTPTDDPSVWYYTP